MVLEQGQSGGGGRCCLANALVDVILELGEVLDELAHQGLRGTVVLCSIGPSCALVEQGAVDARHIDRNLEAG